MGSRSTYARRIEQLESAVVGFGHSVAGRRCTGRAAHHRVVKLAVEALIASPQADEFAIRRVRMLQEVDFHLRHIDRLLDELGPQSRTHLDLRRALKALDLALAGYAGHDRGPLGRLDRAVERVLAGAEPAPVCRIALHMHAIGSVLQSAGSNDRVRRQAPVA
jgi:hypothetical protein